MTHTALPDEVDQLTLARAQKGDAAAQSQLIQTYERRVFALVSRMLGASNRVEDICQDTFLQVLRGLEKFSPLGKAKLSTWILTIAARRCIDELRKSKRAAIVPLDFEPKDTQRDINPKLRKALADAISDLPPALRAAFLLYEVEGLQYQEVAQALSLPIGTIRSRLSRARATLRKALEAHNE